LPPVAAAEAVGAEAVVAEEVVAQEVAAQEVAVAVATVVAAATAVATAAAMTTAAMAVVVTAPAAMLAGMAHRRREAGEGAAATMARARIPGAAPTAKASAKVSPGTA
jgi:hypothetical protein